MSEKKGNTVKLVYDFNTALSCEIEYAPNKWNRVTAREFRSWGGRRRIYHLDEHYNGHFEPYEGPVYYFCTNKVVPESKLQNKIMHLEGRETRPFGKRRQWEKYTEHVVD